MQHKYVGQFRSAGRFWKGRPPRAGCRIRSARHPDLKRTENSNPDHTFYDFENDARYQRLDMSEVFAFQFRLQYAQNVKRGEAGIRLAEAALQVAAEDDAIASHSTVPFPVASYLERIEGMAQELATRRIPPGASPGEAIAIVEQYLFTEMRIHAPPSGRSNMPDRALVDHPGVWEDARLAYMNELLVRRVGHPAALAILYADIMQQLLAAGAIDFAVTMNCGDFSGLPHAAAVPNLTRALVLGGDGGILNTCSSEALVELLRYLKRAYWPFAWDTNVDSPAHGGAGSHGGFRAAAKAAMGEEMSARLRVVSMAAEHRLSRGIWTSPGAGDLRRALAACQRLVMLLGNAAPLERRDLAVLLLHRGEVLQARAELRAFAKSPAAKTAEAFDTAMVNKLLKMLDSMPQEEPGAQTQYGMGGLA